MARNKSYPGNIEKRSGSYRVRLTVDGERHRWTLSDATRAEAKEFARQKHRALRQQAQRRAAGLPTGIQFSGLVRRFREDELPTLTEGTRRSYRDSLKPLEHYFVELQADPKLQQIRTGHVRRYLSWRRMHGPSGQERSDALSNRTLNKDRAVLHRLFEFAFQMEFVVKPGGPYGAQEYGQPRSCHPVRGAVQPTNQGSEAALSDAPYLCGLSR